MPTKPSYLLILLALLTGSLLTGAPVQADQTFIVTLHNDPVPNGCQANHCSLREAVIAANTTPGTDTIVLNEGIYILGRPGEDQTQ
jgi:CSLREA domain-containing protein